jgi:hypothetical protein
LRGWRQLGEKVHFNISGKLQGVEGNRLLQAPRETQSTRDHYRLSGLCRRGPHLRVVYSNLHFFVETFTLPEVDHFDFVPGGRCVLGGKTVPWRCLQLYELVLSQSCARMHNDIVLLPIPTS